MQEDQQQHRVLPLPIRAINHDERVMPQHPVWSNVSMISFDSEDIKLKGMMSKHLQDKGTVVAPFCRQSMNIPSYLQSVPNPLKEFYGSQHPDYQFSLPTIKDLPAAPEPRRGEQPPSLLSRADLEMRIREVIIELPFDEGIPDTIKGQEDDDDCVSLISDVTEDDDKPFVAPQPQDVAKSLLLGQDGDDADTYTFSSFSSDELDDEDTEMYEDDDDLYEDDFYDGFELEEEA